MREKACVLQWARWISAKEDHVLTPRVARYRGEFSVSARQWFFVNLFMAVRSEELNSER